MIFIISGVREARTEPARAVNKATRHQWRLMTWGMERYRRHTVEAQTARRRQSLFPNSTNDMTNYFYLKLLSKTLTVKYYGEWELEGYLHSVGNASQQ
jgi:hypothetical protein